MSDKEDTPSNEAKDKGKIHVAFPNSDPIVFKVKITTPFSKIYAAVAAQKGIDSKSFSLAFDGERINPEQTPKMLEMADNDQIDVQLSQIGGTISLPSRS